MICGHQFSRLYVVNHHVTFICFTFIITYIPAQLICNYNQKDVYVCISSKMVMHSCLRTFTNVHKVELHLPSTLTNAIPHISCLEHSQMICSQSLPPCKFYPQQSQNGKSMYSCLRNIHKCSQS